MQGAPLSGKVALVTGASRGVGRGIALGLGEAGATVYVTGRARRGGAPTVALTGTVEDTAEQVTAAGGEGVAAPCDHTDDAQVAALFTRIRSERGRLDVLVNNAWQGYEAYVDDSWFTEKTGDHFWQHPLKRWDEAFTVGVRGAYVATWHAAPIMVRQGSGLIVNVSFFAAQLFNGQTVYSTAKNAADHLARNYAEELRPYGVAAVALYPGLVRTEGVLRAAEYFDMSNSESPEFQGRAVAALAADPRLMEKSGGIYVTAELAEAYGFTDIDGKQPRSVREEMLGPSSK